MSHRNYRSWTGLDDYDDTYSAASNIYSLRGRGGEDTLTGNFRSNIFVFESNASANGTDNIIDFQTSSFSHRGHVYHHRAFDTLDLSRALGNIRLTGANIDDYVWIKDGALYVDVTGNHNSTDIWAYIESINDNDFVHIRTSRFSRCIQADGDFSGGGDSEAPTLSALSLNYNENQLSGVTTATVTGAADNVGVTQYRFVYADNTTISTTSEDGNFSIDSSGNITLTTAGLTSAVNNYEAGVSQSHTLNVQAGDAANNWSTAAAITLNEQDVSAASGFTFPAFFDDYWGNDIFGVWIPSSTYDPQGTAVWYVYKNGSLTTNPDSYPIPFNGGTQGQIQWNGTSTFEPGDSIEIVAIVGGVAYESALYTIPLPPP